MCCMPCCVMTFQASSSHINFHSHMFSQWNLLFGSIFIHCLITFNVFVLPNTWAILTDLSIPHACNSLAIISLLCTKEGKKKRDREKTRGRQRLGKESKQQFSTQPGMQPVLLLSVWLY